MALHSYDVGVVGCLLQAGLRVGTAYARSGRGGRLSTWTALVDTGAMRTAISPAVVRNLAPQPLETAVIRRPDAESEQVRIYQVELKFDGHLVSGRWFDLEVVVAQPAVPGVDILIVLDLL